MAAKSLKQINGIINAANIWKIVRKQLIKATIPGKSLLELDQLAYEVINQQDASPTFKNYHGFPGNICISVNDELIHGVPRNYKLKAGDMVTFDVGVTYKQYIADAAFTVLVGLAKQDAIKINDITYKSLQEAIKVIKPWIKTGLIGYTVQRYVEQNGYHVVKDFTGHGCGVKLHEPPSIPNYGDPDSGDTVLENEVLCIEPMVLTTSPNYVIDPIDQWTVRSTDKSLTCHWEHMVLVTKTGCQILTAEEEIDGR